MNTAEYLAELIPSPNSLQPLFTAWVSTFIQLGVDIQTVLNSMPADFSIDDAVGNQLDVLGQILGVSRQVDFDPGGGATSILTDDYYRVALKARIILNQWKGTKDEIYDFWAIYLPEYPVLILDNQDMSMSVLVIGMPNDLTGTSVFALGPVGGTGPDGEILAGLGTGYWYGYQSTLRGLVTHNYFTPKPAGVSVDYSFSDQTIFALGFETDLLKGLGEGYFVSFS